MKTYSRAAILVTCLLTIAAGTGNTPLTSEHANHAILMADGSGPIQTCRPGTNCGDDQLRQMADGSGPIQTCRSGTNCDPDEPVRLAILPATSKLAGYTGV